ncbi:MAG: hypothetical protein EOO04_19800 [Chitinophagaceae bacterium]|nr:MAG: hypothetical protein EOO04_19800 [Chitinophagaceae bacterium]
MIKINKSAAVPAILSGQGVTLTNGLINTYAQNRPSYTSAPGVSNRTLLPLTFDSDVYGDPTVKQALIADQHGKCCFCEATFSDNSYGDVEHFRPKKAYKIRAGTGLTYPGYYWLAYDWTNLLFSCEKCNRSFKGNLFPLHDETTRKPHHDHPNLLANEDRLLIDPNVEDAALFITFKEEVPVPLNNNAKGATSIRAFNLERMNNSRLDYLLLLDAVLVFTKIDPANNEEVQAAMDGLSLTRQKLLELIASANHFANTVAKATGKFALCVRSKFPHLPTA